MKVEDPEFAEFIRETATKLAKMIEDNIDRVPFPLDAIPGGIMMWLQFEREYWRPGGQGVRIKPKKCENKRPTEPRLSLVK